MSENGVDADTKNAMRRASLRRQVEALTVFRDAMMSEPDDYYEAYAIALAPITDRVFHELMELEGVPPYPHPLQWFEYLTDAMAHTEGAVR